MPDKGAGTQLKVVAIGAQDELTCLRSVGVHVPLLPEEADWGAELRRYAQDETVGLILISETLVGERQKVVDGLRRDLGAVILVVPAARGSKDTTLLFMKHTLEQSIGVDLISRD